MDHGMAFTQQPAPEDLTKEDIVIADRMLRRDGAFEVRQRLAQYGRAPLWALDLQPDKRRLFQGEAAAKMNDHVGLAIVENIDGKRGTLGEPGAHWPAL